MENSKKFLGGYIIVFLVLVGYFVYPGFNYFQRLGRFYTIIGFLGILAYISYLFLELRKKNQTRSLPSQNSNTSLQEERKYTDFFSSMSDPNEKYHQLTNKLVKTIKQSLIGDSAFFYLYNPRDNYYRLQHYATDHNIELNQIIDGYEFYDEFRQAARPRIYNEEELKNIGCAHYPELQEIKSLMLVPVLFGGFIGFVGLDSREKDAWGQHDLELLTEYTNIISQFIAQLENMDKLNRKIDFLQELEELNLSIQNEQDLNSVYREYVNLLEKYLSYDKLTIVSYSDKSSDNKVIIDFIDGVETDYTVGFRFDLKNSIFEDIMHSDKLLVNNYDESDVIYRFRSV